MATFTVNNATELIERIIQCNNTSEADVIKLRPGTYNLSDYDGYDRASDSKFIASDAVPGDFNGLPLIIGNITLQGTTSNPNNHIITRNGTLSTA